MLVPYNSILANSRVDIDIQFSAPGDLLLVSAMPDLLLVYRLAPILSLIEGQGVLEQLVSQSFSRPLFRFLALPTRISTAALPFIVSSQAHPTSKNDFNVLMATYTVIVADINFPQAVNTKQQVMPCF